MLATVVAHSLRWDSSLSGIGLVVQTTPIRMSGAYTSQRRKHCEYSPYHLDLLCIARSDEPTARAQSVRCSRFRRCSHKFVRRPTPAIPCLGPPGTVLGDCSCVHTRSSWK